MAQQDQRRRIGKIEFASLNLEQDFEVAESLKQTAKMHLHRNFSPIRLYFNCLVMKSFRAENLRNRFTTVRCVFFLNEQPVAILALQNLAIIPSQSVTNDRA